MVTAPAEEPVTLEELTEFGRIPEDLEELFLESLITAARQHVESPLTGRALLTQTWDYTVDDFPAWEFCIPRPPLQSVTSITYKDSSGATVVLAGSHYVVDTISTPGRITPAYGDAWPSTRGDPNSVTVRFVAGWANPSLVPQNLRHAIKVIAETMYEHREQFVVGETVNELPIVQRLVAEHRMYGVSP